MHPESCTKKYTYADIRSADIPKITEKYLIKDSLLLPVLNENFRICKGEISLTDMTFMSNEEDMCYHIRFYETYQFKFFSTEDPRYSFSTEGTWRKEGDRVVMNEAGGYDYLSMICTNGIMRIVGKLIIGKVYNKKNKQIEYHYF